MSRIRSFFANLKKSTVITLISCGCFVVLAFMILCFFILFPITPSEKVMATFGRESVAKNDAGSNSAVTTLADGGESIVVSKGSTMTSSTSASTTTRRITTTHKEFKITITTGSGFYSGGIIMTGDYSYEGIGYGSPTTTTSAAEYVYPAGTGEEPVNVTPTEPVVTGIDPNVTPTEPIITPTEPVITPTEPQIPDPPPVDDPPVVTPTEPANTGSDTPHADTPSEW